MNRTPRQTAQADQPGTMLDRLIEHLRSKDVGLDGQERPAAILWTDPHGDWRPMIALLRTRVEELLTLGEYRPEERRGPAIWSRCLVDGALTEPALPPDRVPILVIRDVLRWMGNPAGAQARLGESGWGAFCSRCRDELDFDPSTEAGVTPAGEGAAEALPEERVPKHAFQLHHGHGWSGAVRRHA